MRIYSDAPEIDSDELERFWMPPHLVAAAADIHDHRHFAKTLGNWSDRALIAFKKTGEGKTSPRLYSLRTAIQACFMYRLTAFGADVKSAKTVADWVVADFEQRLKVGLTYEELSQDNTHILYWFDGMGKIQTLITDAECIKLRLKSEWHLTYRAGEVEPPPIRGWIELDYILRRCLETYSDIAGGLESNK